MSVIRWDTNQSFPCVQDGDMVQKIIAGDLIIPAGVTITTQYRCKGLHIQVRGNMYLYGTIDMTARGANAAGANVGMEFYSDRNLITLNGGNYAGLPTVRKIAAAGAAGGSNVMASYDSKNGHNSTSGVNGTAGVNGQCGGGGSGSSSASNTGLKYVFNQSGGPGTSFSGGPGSGGVFGMSSVAGSYTFGTIPGANGGSGGTGASDGSPGVGGASGGAGNPGGAGFSFVGGDGTGGLIIISVLGYLYIAAGAVIKADGVSGGYGSGGGSGGGSINIFYGAIVNSGAIQANGGPIVGAFIADEKTSYGSAGGAGSIRLNSLRTT